MKIIQLKAGNVKRLKAVEITPVGNVVELRGMNAAGKSSVLDAIAMALGGKKLCPDKPIREGQSKALIEVDLGDIIVRRTFTAKDSHLTVTAQGAEQKSPQMLLDKLIGKLTFDPLEFTRLDKTTRRATLMSLVGLTDQLAKLDKEYEAAFALRTQRNREVARLKGVVDSTIVPDNTPDEPIDVEALQAEHKAKTAEAEAVRQRQETFNKLAREAAQLETTIGELDGQILKLKRDRDERQQRHGQVFEMLDGQRKELADAPTPDPSAIVAQLAAATTVNANVAKKHDLAKHRQDHQQSVAQAEAHTDTLNSLIRDKAAILANAQYPIPGLAFDGEDVTFNGLPFSQASQAEKLTISLAIAMVMNPTLRVLLIRDGSLLDDTVLKMLYEHVTTVGYQLWIERVGEDGASDASVIIEDGAIKGGVA